MEDATIELDSPLIHGGKRYLDFQNPSGSALPSKVSDPQVTLKAERPSYK